jgi:hypothetical protein
LIDDKSYDIRLAYIEDSSGEQILDYKNSKVSTISNFNDEILKTYNEKMKQNELNKDGVIHTGGTSLKTSAPNNNTFYIYTALGILFLIPAVYLIRRNTGSKS